MAEFTTDHATIRQWAESHRAFLDQIERVVPPGLEVHLVLDNLKTHRTRLIHDWLVKRPRFHLHFTPASASRLNLVECWFALLSRRRLERGAFTSTDDLERESDPRLHRRGQRRSEAPRVDQDRRRHPRQRRPLPPTNF
jgi:transposase